MAKYYCRSYFTTIGAKDDDDESRYSAEGLPTFRRYMMWNYEHTDDLSKLGIRDDSIFGKSFMYFRNPMKVYDNSRCRGKPIGIFIFHKNYYVWKTEKGHYRVKRDGTLSNGVR